MQNWKHQPPLGREFMPAPRVMRTELYWTSSWILTSLTAPISQMGKRRHREGRGGVGRAWLYSWVVGSGPQRSVYPTGAAHRTWSEGADGQVDAAVR